MSIHSPFILTLQAAILLAACTQDKFNENSPHDGEVTINVSVSGANTRVGLSDDHSEFIWNEGDAVNVFNNADNSTIQVEAANDGRKYSMPLKASSLYGLYPYDQTSVNGPKNVKVSIPASYTQSRPGHFDVPGYPMWASAEIVAGNADLKFSPLVTVLVLEIYRTGVADGDEKIQSIRVTPLSNTGFTGSGVVDLTASAPAFSKGEEDIKTSQVTLSTPCDIHDGVIDKSDRKSYAGKIYIPLARQNYNGIRFEILTDTGFYSITSPKGLIFPGTTADFIITTLDITNGLVETENIILDGAEEVSAYNETLTHDIIPDFSRVGYHYGETPLPTLSVAATISPADVSEALSKGVADTTSYIQSVIDQVGSSGGGAILLKNGTYNIGSILFIDADNVVLRGESETGTIIKATGTTPRTVIYLGKTVPASGESNAVNGRKVNLTPKELENAKTGETYTAYSLTPSGVSIKTGARTEITEDYTPSGRLWIEVSQPSLFTAGSRIAIYRPATLQWIQAIHMDKIADKPGTVQWDTKIESFDEYYYRRVVAVKGKRIYLDSPLVMGLDRQYGVSYAMRYTVSSIVESGVENLTIDSSYDPIPTYHTYYWEQDVPSDENHAWYGITIGQAEHCWIRNVTTKHMAMSCILASSGRYITVKDCTSLEPVSVATGGRRYAFYVLGGQMVLFTGCKCEKDRHACVTSSSRGPIVYHKCTCTDNFSDLGPHQRWSTGVLYDNVYTDGWLYVRDRGPSGNGHGWAGANHVFWNCTVEYGGSSKDITNGRLICQSPWASAKNYCIGCYGHEMSQKEERTYTGGGYNDPEEGAKYHDWCRDNIPGYDGRPMGEWYPARQKDERGGEKVYLPDAFAAAQFEWWPQLTLTEFKNNMSLYECQLQDRMASGQILSGLY